MCNNDYLVQPAGYCFVLLWLHNIERNLDSAKWLKMAVGPISCQPHGLGDLSL